MALGTLTKVDQYTVSNKRFRVYDVQLTSGANYTTGGEQITAKSVGLNVIQEARTSGIPVASDGSTSRTIGVLFQTDGSVKIPVQTTASAQAASNSDQSAYTVRITFVGR